jgi:hypothetical protein
MPIAPKDWEWQYDYATGKGRYVPPGFEYKPDFNSPKEKYKPSNEASEKARANCREHLDDTLEDLMHLEDRCLKDPNNYLLKRILRNMRRSAEFWMHIVARQSRTDD